MISFAHFRGKRKRQISDRFVSRSIHVVNLSRLCLAYNCSHKKRPVYVIDVDNNDILKSVVMFVFFRQNLFKLSYE